MTLESVACNWAFVVNADGSLERMGIEPGRRSFVRPVREPFDVFKVPTDPAARIGYREDRYERLFGSIGAHGPRVFAPEGLGYSIWKSRHMFTLELMRDRLAFSIVFNRWLERAIPAAAVRSVLICIKHVDAPAPIDCATFEAWGVAVPLPAAGVIRSNLESVVDRAIE